MPVICGGLCLCMTQEVNFHLVGVLSCIGAAVLRGLKSIVQGKLLSGERKLHSVELQYYTAPYMAVVLFLFASAMEGSEPLLLICVRPWQTSSTGFPQVLALLLLTAFNAW